jgi:hypothetical protein
MAPARSSRTARLSISWSRVVDKDAGQAAPLGCLHGVISFGWLAKGGMGSFSFLSRVCGANAPGYAEPCLSN